jgi:hypothetical protein
MGQIKLIILILLLTVADPCFGQDYIIPQPDHNEKKPSPPSIEGKIKSIFAAKIIVVTKNIDHKKSKLVTVKITKSTAMFTVYGGAVAPKELSIGQKVKIWFTEKNPTKTSPVAAVIMLASTNPDDDWP